MSKLPVVITVIYLVLVGLSVIPIFTGDDSLSGIFALVLTAPWSILFGRLLPSSAFNTVSTGLALTAVGALINAAIIYFVLRYLTR